MKGNARGVQEEDEMRERGGILNTTTTNKRDEGVVHGRDTELIVTYSCTLAGELVNGLIDVVDGFTDAVHGVEDGSEDGIEGLKEGVIPDVGAGGTINVDYGVPDYVSGFAGGIEGYVGGVDDVSDFGGDTVDVEFVVVDRVRIVHGCVGCVGCVDGCVDGGGDGLGFTEEGKCAGHYINALGAVFADDIGEGQKVACVALVFFCEVDDADEGDYVTIGADCFVGGIDDYGDACEEFIDDFEDG